MTTDHAQFIDSEIDYIAQYDDGVKLFARLFTRWMDTNEWSHPVMTHLTRCAMNGTGWLHSSQISGIRHGKLISPGPRTFVAIATLNAFLHRYETQNLLIPNTTSSNNYHKAKAITEDGIPPDAGWWLKVFCGICTPKDFDLSSNYYSEDQATSFSNKWARYFRRTVAQQGFDLIEDLPRIIRDHYPAGDTDRVSKLISVIRAEATWGADELLNEMPALTALTGAIGGPSDEKRMFSEIG